jgi:hypothetical protein
VHDALARGHPLNRLDNALVTGIVPVAHAPVKQVGYGLESAMWMRRKAGDIVVRIVGAKRVQQQERIEIHQRWLPDNPHQLDSGTVGCRLTANYPLCLANLHATSRSVVAG